MSVVGKKLKLLFFKVFFGVMVVILLSFFIINIYKAPNRRVDKGILDLTNYNFDEKGILKLDGEWEFYWQKFLSYEDFQGSISPEYYSLVPQVWKSIGDLSGDGYGTYRITVVTQLEQGTVLSLRLNTISSSYRILFDDVVITEVGVVSADAKTAHPEYDIQTISFTVPKSTFNIIIQVSNYHYHEGGIWYSIYLGYESQIENFQKFSN